MYASIYTAMKMASKRSFQYFRFLIDEQKVMQVLRLYKPWYGVEYALVFGGLHDLGTLCFNEGSCIVTRTMEPVSQRTE